jgi:hypothetical protein
LRVTDLDEDGLMSFYNITELGCVQECGRFSTGMG